MYNRRHCSVGLQLNSGDLAAGSRSRHLHLHDLPRIAKQFEIEVQVYGGTLCAPPTRPPWDHEVEVPPCERGANPSKQLPGEKSDRSADASGVCHRLLSPFRNKRRSNRFKKTLLLESKTGRQRLRQGRRSEPGIVFLHVGHKYVEGLFYLIA